VIVVSNASPIINLAAIGHLQLLNHLYAKIIIPQAVYDEIAVKGAGEHLAEARCYSKGPLRSGVTHFPLTPGFRPVSPVPPKPKSRFSGFRRAGRTAPSYR